MTTLSVNSQGKLKDILAYIAGAIGVLCIGWLDNLVKAFEIFSIISEQMVPILQVVSLCLIIGVGMKKWRKYNKKETKESE